MSTMFSHYKVFINKLEQLHQIKESNNCKDLE